MSPTRRALTLLAVLAALGAAAAGCGSDDEETTVPSISVPEGESQTVPEATITEPTTATPPSGGTGTKTKPSAPEDSATNDIPPPPGSPQEAFEKACEKNPAACG